jgi:hypothetical protein
MAYEKAESKEAKLEAIQKQIDKLIEERERLKSDVVQQEES